MSNEAEEILTKTEKQKINRLYGLGIDSFIEQLIDDTETATVAKMKEKGYQKREDLIRDVAAWLESKGLLVNTGIIEVMKHGELN